MSTSESSFDCQVCGFHGFSPKCQLASSNTAQKVTKSLTLDLGLNFEAQDYNRDLETFATEKYSICVHYIHIQFFFSLMIISCNQRKTKIAEANDECLPDKKVIIFLENKYFEKSQHKVAAKPCLKELGDGAFTMF